MPVAETISEHIVDWMRAAYDANQPEAYGLEQPSANCPEVGSILCPPDEYAQTDPGQRELYDHRCIHFFGYAEGASPGETKKALKQGLGAMAAGRRLREGGWVLRSVFRGTRFENLAVATSEGIRDWIDAGLAKLDPMLNSNERGFLIPATEEEMGELLDDGNSLLEDLKELAQAEMEMAEAAAESPSRGKSVKPWTGSKGKISGEERAIIELLRHPGWSDTKIAEAADVNRTSLYGFPKFKKARGGQRPDPKSKFGMRTDLA